MQIDAIHIGNNPPDDVNVIIEVPIGGEPIKYEMDKASGTLVVDRFLHTNSPPNKSRREYRSLRTSPFRFQICNHRESAE
jgi:inorganic pyrophosphatase